MREEEGLECQRVIFKPSLPPVDEIIKEESSRVYCVPHTQPSPQLLWPPVDEIIKEESSRVYCVPHTQPSPQLSLPPQLLLLAAGEGLVKFITHSDVPRCL